MTINCTTCEYKQIHSRVSTGKEHCYMFEDEPEDCNIWRNSNVRSVGRYVGHIDHIEISTSDLQTMLRLGNKK